MSRPNAEQVGHALHVIESLCVSGGDSADMDALDVLSVAVAPRPVWPAKETAACLRVDPSNLNDVRGLPEPAQVLPRPSSTHPAKVMRLWFVDEVEDLAAVRRVERKG